jgi:putative inorganic carbon (HCO3(-)) transporter
MLRGQMKTLVQKVSAVDLALCTQTSLLVFWASLIFSSALVEISFIFALIFWILWKVRDRRVPQIDRNLLFLAGGLILWTALSLIWSEVPKASSRGFLKVAQQVLLFLMTADAFSHAAIERKWEKVFVIVLIVLAADSAVQYAFGRDLIRGFPYHEAGAGPRITASFKTYGLLASFLITTLPLLLMMALRPRDPGSKNPRRLFLLCLFGAGLVLLYLTRSRGAILAFVLGMILMLVLRRQWLVLGGLVAALTCGLFLLPKAMVIHLDQEYKEQSLVERYYLWDRALHVIKAKPLTGTGINTYAAAHQKYDKTQNWRVRNYYAHNGYLQMAAEIGIPGLLLFLVLVGYSFACGIQAAPPWQPLTPGAYPVFGLMISLTVFLIFALVDTVLHNPQSAMTFWYLLGLLPAWTRRQTQKSA